MGKQVCGEESDGDGVTVFQVAPHLLRKVGTQLFERVPVVAFDPGREPHHAPVFSTPDDTALDDVDRVRVLGLAEQIFQMGYGCGGHGKRGTESGVIR